ncbi:MAG: glycosyltransferase family 4 protein [Bacteroidaceae bacterium]|nr:glycosyltransferase family 4 protein [Bacteroidaceae bacterium]
MVKIIRAATIGMSLNIFCRGLLSELKDEGYEVIALSSPDGDLAELGRREKVRTIGVSMERHVSPLKDLISLIRLIRVMRKERPVMVHSMTPKAGLLCMMAAWIAHVPIRVHTFTGLVWPTQTGLSRKILMLTDRITCFCATHIIPEGEGVKHDLSSCITDKPMRVLGYGNVRGVDLDYWKRSGGSRTEGWLSERREKKEPFTFVFVGRIVRDKGINELVNAFSRLNKNYPDTRLLLVGPVEDDLDPVLPETRMAIEKEESIISVGSQKDVRPYYEASDALVFPSYREGFPNVVLEAGAMELPSIVTDINGSREIIEEGVNGVIVPPRDESALYEAMEDMVTHPEKVSKMSAKSRPMIAARYEQSFVRMNLKHFYSELFLKNVCGVKE